MAPVRDQQLSDSPMVGVRLGPLRPRVEAMCKLLGVEMSELIRGAIERELNSKPFEVAPYAIYLGATAEFVALAKAATELGLFSRDSYVALVHAVQPTERQVQEKLEPLFRKLYPDETTPGEFHSWRVREDLRRKEGLKDAEMIGPEHVEKWNSALSSLGHFPDLQRARRALLRLLPKVDPSSREPTLEELKELRNPKAERVRPLPPRKRRRTSRKE